MANARAAGRLANVFLLTAVLVSAQVSSGPTPPTKIPPSVASAVQVVAGIAVARLKQQEDVNKVRNAIVIRGDDLAAFAVAAALAGDQVKSVEYEPAYIASVETKRTDKQVGASSFVSGSTSAVSKPSVPQLLGL